MNKFSEEEKRQVLRLADKAEQYFFKYRSFCEKIAQLLNEKNPDERQFITDFLLYQMSDGLCVCYENSEYYAPINIPISDYLDGSRK